MNHKVRSSRQETIAEYEWFKDKGRRLNDQQSLDFRQGCSAVPATVQLEADCCVTTGKAAVPATVQLEADCCVTVC